MSKKVNTQPNVIELEIQALGETKHKHWKDIEITTDLLNAFIVGFNHIGSAQLSEDNETEYIWLLIVTRSFHSMMCARHLASRGYYSQSMFALRSITEDWFICRACRNNKVIRDVILRNEGKMPRYSDMAKATNALNIYEKDYRFQSRFTHSTSLSLAVLIDPDTNRLRTAPVYDQLLFLNCIETLLKNGVMMLEYLMGYIAYVDADKAKSYDAEVGQKVKNATNWLRELKNRYGDSDTK